MTAGIESGGGLELHSSIADPSFEILRKAVDPGLIYTSYCRLSLQLPRVGAWLLSRKLDFVNTASQVSCMRNKQRGGKGDGQEIYHFPTLSSSTSTTSPFFKKSGGVFAIPTPDGLGSVSNYRVAR